MQKLNFSIVINAPKEKVWHTMLDDSTYRLWTSVFNPQGSYYKGDWKKGSKILFIGPDEQGKLGGMVSQIEENRPYEYISIKHVGVIEDGKEDTTSEAAKKWAPAFENYTFKERDGGTEVLVDMDINDEYKKMFDDMWPKGLQKLKQLAESKKASPITIETTVNAPIEKIWEAWTKPEHIVQWTFASDGWEAPHAENDVRTGGKFKTIMAAKDKSAGFDFTGVYTNVREHELIEYDMDDGRHVKIEFTQFPDGVKIIETFDPENENSEEIQRSGWQAILDNFKKYVEINIKK